MHDQPPIPTPASTDHPPKPAPSSDVPPTATEDEAPMPESFSEVRDSTKTESAGDAGATESDDAKGAAPTTTEMPETKTGRAEELPRASGVRENVADDLDAKEVESTVLGDSAKDSNDDNRVTETGAAAKSAGSTVRKMDEAVETRTCQNDEPEAQDKTVETGRLPQQLSADFASQRSADKVPEMSPDALNLSSLGEALPRDTVTPSSSSTEQPSASILEPSSRTTPAPESASQIYQIKHLNLLGPGATTVSNYPILLQNVNGPCPLLALVNAITLSKPECSLTSVLKLREQISLDLLLQAVLEELFARAPENLPDVGELFAFFNTLHTGMNVNPCFVPKPPSVLGGFEETKEITLYSSFQIPIIHGWIPSSNAPIHAALSRSAKTYDEAVNLSFTEEELITRLTTSDTIASAAEQQLLSDAAEIKAFVESTATQLTVFGLESLRWGLEDGGVAVFFRNDHFSTIMRRGEVLVQLVTDAGYGNLDEVAWESLNDTSGAGHLLSGDFRPVGGAGKKEGKRERENERRRERENPPLPPRNNENRVAVESQFSEAAFQEAQEQGLDEDYNLAMAIALQDDENRQEDEIRWRERQRKDQREREWARSSHGGGNGRGEEYDDWGNPSNRQEDGWQQVQGRRRGGGRGRGAGAGAGVPMERGAGAGRGAGRGKEEEKEGDDGKKKKDNCVLM